MSSTSIAARSRPRSRRSTCLLYISFFPQLVAGPIIRASDFLPQLKTEPKLDRAMVANGIVLILLGLFKKMVIANYLANELVDGVFFDPSAFSGPDLLLALYGYAVQIYCDFSGYSDIAIGVAGLLGYHFKPNFMQPYRAASLREFWQRWHISLSSWLRDYLYKPLGGSHHGTAQTYRNLLITMLLGGLWHGAAFTFIVWGAIHGTALVIERMILAFKPAPVQIVQFAGYGPVGRVLAFGAMGGQAFGKALSVFVTFNIVCLAWIFFRSGVDELCLGLSAGLDRLVRSGGAGNAISGGTDLRLARRAFRLGGSRRAHQRQTSRCWRVDARRRARLRHLVHLGDGARGSGAVHLLPVLSL